MAVEHPYFARELNAGVRAVSGNFDKNVASLAWLPMLDVGLALREVAGAAADPNTVGAVVGTSLGSRLCDDDLEPVWRAMSEAGLALFVHPDSDPFQPHCTPFQNPTTTGFLAATTSVALQLLTRAGSLWGSGLKVCLSHGGGFLATALPRVERSQDADAGLIRERLAQVWVDSVLFDEPSRMLARSAFGQDRLLPGSDWPFPLSIPAPELVRQQAGGHVAGRAEQWAPRLAALPAPAASGAAP